MDDMEARSRVVLCFKHRASVKAHFLTGLWTLVYTQCSGWRCPELRQASGQSQAVDQSSRIQSIVLVEMRINWLEWQHDLKNKAFRMRAKLTRTAGSESEGVRGYPPPLNLRLDSSLFEGGAGMKHVLRYIERRRAIEKTYINGNEYQNSLKATRMI